MSDELTRDLDRLIMFQGCKSEIQHTVEMFVDKHHKELLLYENWDEIREQKKATESFLKMSHTFNSTQYVWNDEEWLFALLTTFIASYWDA